MVIDNVCYNRDRLRGGIGSEWNERNSKPPLATWAAWRIHQVKPERQWLAEIYPKLVAFHHWWYRNRDHNRNGLAEFGATDHPEHNDEQGRLKFFIERDVSALDESTLVAQCRALPDHQMECFGEALYRQALQQNRSVQVPAQDGAGYESGMDNAARFGFIDDDQLRREADRHYNGDLHAAQRDWRVGFYANRDEQQRLLGYSIDQESVDLNAFLYADKLLLAEMALQLGKPRDAKSWQAQAARLQQQLNDCFFDAESGFYYDRKMSEQGVDARGCANGELMTKRGRGSEAFAMLWSGAASAANAKRMMATLMRTDEFNTFVPLATASKNNPAYNPRIYWRGRVWIDQVYFALSGMKRYGYRQQAQDMAKRLLKNAEGISGSGPLRENYDPETGAGQGPANFSWTAAHLWMIEREILRD